MISSDVGESFPIHSRRVIFFFLFFFFFFSKAYDAVSYRGGIRYAAELGCACTTHGYRTLFKKYGQVRFP